jgi:hypothetical protein
MKQAVKSPFESIYGFKGPGFSVDAQGNIIANSIITSSTPDAGSDASFVDFKVTEQGTDFLFNGIEETNPTITIARQTVYTFEIDVPNNRFAIYNSDQSSFFSSGLTHSDGTEGDNAQIKTEGTLRFAVPISAPDTLYYGDVGKTTFGVINVVDAAGQFGNVSVTANTASTSTSTGALTVDGGVGILGDLFIGGSLNVAGTGITELISTTNLSLGAANKVIFKIDGSNIGSVSSTGLSIPITNSEINNTTIGNVTPSTAAFTSATVNTDPETSLGVTNKGYVDSTATALAIAFGL